MWVLLFLLLIKFLIVLEELANVLIPRFLKFFFNDVCGGIVGYNNIYQCNELLSKELLYWIFGEKILRILSDFILRCCMKDLGYWSCEEIFYAVKYIIWKFWGAYPYR